MQEQDEIKYESLENVHELLTQLIEDATLLEAFVRIEMLNAERKLD